MRLPFDKVGVIFTYLFNYHAMVNLTPRKRAFTLIELLIVITIIGILAVAFIPRLAGASGRARDAQRKSDLQQIASALEFYAQDNGGLYPTAPSTNCIPSLTNYLTTTPVDPSNPTAAIGTGFCATGYTYKALNSQTGYLLVADLESTTDRAASGIYTKSSVTGATYGGTTTASTYLTSTFTACTTTTASCTSGTTDIVAVVGR